MTGAAPATPLLQDNPFPGLRSFEPSESALFFGRREQIDALAALLDRQPLLAVSGASGCGKSSLVKAGLLNELRRRHEEDDETDWRALVMRPGNRPIAQLAAALAPVLGAPEEPGAPDAPADADGMSALETRVASLHGQLRQGALALLEVVRRARLPADTRLLVVVDQFEEIFRMKRLSDAEEASAFVKLLLQAAQEPGSAIRVILTLRSDTLGGCAEFPGLPEAVSAGSYLVPRLSRNQRKEAITGPVALRGRAIAPRLVQRLLGDVSADFDDLPVMQHALSRTWTHWATHSDGQRPIDLEDYEAVGAATAALSRHADEAWADLEPGQAPGGTVERVFRTLTERVAGGLELRRPVELRELLAICDDGTSGARERIRRTVDRYRRPDTAFLLPAGTAPLADDTVVDISHESLIRQWQSLRRWLDQEAESARIYQRLASTAALHARGEARHWRQPDLGVALAWRQAQRPNASWARRYEGDFVQAMDFLDDSFEGEQAEIRQRQYRMRNWLAAGVVSVVLLVVGVLTGLLRDYEAQDTRNAAAENTYASFRFFEHLHEAAGELQRGRVREANTESAACARAGDLINGLEWRRSQHKDFCDRGATDDPVKRGRLEANKQIARGQIETATAMLENMQGDAAVRVFLNLQRLANLDADSMRAERTLLLAHKRQTPAEAGPVANCVQKVLEDFRHPVHRSIATTFCSGGDLNANQSRLVNTYELHARETQGRWKKAAAAGPAPAASSPAKATFDIKKDPPSVTLRNLEWVYWQVAKNATRPASAVGTARGLLSATFRQWRYEFLVVLLPVMWTVWRQVQRRRGTVFTPAPPVWRRAAAMTVDNLIAVGIMLLGIAFLLLTHGLLQRGELFVPDAVAWVLMALTPLPALAYVLWCDAIHLRHRRSIGKLIFDLRPVLDEGPNPGEISLRHSAQRNAPMLVPLALMLLVAMPQQDSVEFGPLRWTVLVLFLAFTAWLWLLKGRSLGERWSRTHVIDADSAESRALDRPARYLPRAVRAAPPPQPPANAPGLAIASGSAAAD